MKARVPKLRTVLRWVHIIISIPIYGYLYSPFDKLPLYAKPTRYVFFPIMVLTGLWMWKGYVIERLIWKRTGQAVSGQAAGPGQPRLA